jgi:hypothetical protein
MKRINPDTGVFEVQHDFIDRMLDIWYPED